MTESNVTFEFERVAFFGRSIEEYVTMFNLNLPGLKGKSVLDCCAGPAAFAVQGADLGIRITAVDPMYKLTPGELRQFVDADAAVVTQKQMNNKGLIYEEVVPTAERRKAMEVFLQDYAEKDTPGRYVVGQLPELPFDNQSFDLVLSANFLFIYSDTESGGMLKQSPFDYRFHSRSLKELLRLCRQEVRLYPLVGPKTTNHKYLPDLMKECQDNGFEPSVEPVPQRDLIGAEQMLRIRRVG